MASSLFLRNERELMKKMKESGAISEQTAKTIEELKLSKFEIRVCERVAHWTLTKSIKEITDEKGKKRYYVTQ